MKLKMYLITTIIGHIIVLLGTIGLINQSKKNLLDSNLKSLSGQVLSSGQSVGTINLSNLTNFEWDVVYSFSPYMPIESINKVLSFKFDGLKETVNEGMNQIVFVRSGKVVCYLYGYPSNNGYGISFDSTDYKNGVVMYYPKDNLNFKVTKSKDVIYLEHVK